MTVALDEFRTIHLACRLQPACLCYRRNTCRLKPARRSGFTLIEVLVTMLLLSILVPILMQGLTLSLHAASSARHKTEAANIAQDELNGLVSSGQWTSNPQGTTGEYNWQCQSVNQDYGLSEVRLTVSWNEQGQPRQLVVSTFAQTNPVLPGSDTTTTTTTQ